MLMLAISVLIMYQVDSTAKATELVAVGRIRRENELERQLEYAHAEVTY